MRLQANRVFLLFLTGIFLTPLSALSGQFLVRDVLLSGTNPHEVAPIILTLNGQVVGIDEYRSNGDQVTTRLQFDGEFIVVGDRVYWIDMSSELGRSVPVAELSRDPRKVGGLFFYEVQWDPRVELIDETTSPVEIARVDVSRTAEHFQRALERVIREVTDADRTPQDLTGASPALEAQINQFIETLEKLLQRQGVEQELAAQTVGNLRTHLMAIAPNVDRWESRSNDTGPLFDRLNLLSQAYLYLVERIRLEENPDARTPMIDQAFKILAEITLTAGRTFGSPRRRNLSDRKASLIMTAPFLLGGFAFPPAFGVAFVLMADGFGAPYTGIPWPGGSGREARRAARVAMDRAGLVVSGGKPLQGGLIGQLLEHIETTPTVSSTDCIMAIDPTKRVGNAT